MDFEIRHLKSFSEIYRFENKIGEGGFGKVIESYRWDNGKKYACKIVKRTKDYLRELDHLLHLIKNDCRYTLPLRNVYFTEKEMCMEMEFSEFSLFETISNIRRKNISDLKTNLDNCVRMAFKLLMGINDMHASNIIHRDIKPANIMMMNGTPKIIDLGMSKRVYSDNQLTDISNYELITAPYRAPEMWQNDMSFLDHLDANERSKDIQPITINSSCDIEYNAKVDEWAVGCIVFEYMTGVSLFGNAKNIQIDIRKKIASHYLFQFGKHNRKLYYSTDIEPYDLMSHFDSLILKRYGNGKKCIAITDETSTRLYDAVKKILRFLLVCKKNSRYSACDVLQQIGCYHVRPNKTQRTLNYPEWTPENTELILNVVVSQMNILKQMKMEASVLWLTINLFLHTCAFASDAFFKEYDHVEVFQSCLQISLGYFLQPTRHLYTLKKMTERYKKETLNNEKCVCEIVIQNNGSIWIENPAIYRNLYFPDSESIWCAKTDEKLFTGLINIIKLRFTIPSVRFLYNWVLQAYEYKIETK